MSDDARFGLICLMITAALLILTVVWRSASILVQLFEKGTP